MEISSKLGQHDPNFSKCKDSFQWACTSTSNQTLGEVRFYAVNLTQLLSCGSIRSTACQSNMWGVKDISYHAQHRHGSSQGRLALEQVSWNTSKLTVRCYYPGVTRHHRGRANSGVRFICQDRWESVLVLFETHLVGNLFPGLEVHSGPQIYMKAVVLLWESMPPTFN